jgi:hypothetical protein
MMILLVLSLVGLGGYVLGQFQGVLANDSTPAGLQALRETLLAETSSVRGNWLRTLNPLVKDVQGDLVWNSAQQQGVMRFVNLPSPKAGHFYQLWLYDTRGESDAAVSGAELREGSGRGELFVPIKTATTVEEPYKFVLALQAEGDKKVGQTLLMVQP